MTLTTAKRAVVVCSRLHAIVPSENSFSLTDWVSSEGTSSAPYKQENSCLQAIVHLNYLIGSFLMNSVRVSGISTSTVVGGSFIETTWL